MEQNTVANVPVVEAPAQADVAQDTAVYAADLLKSVEQPKAETPPPAKPATQKPAPTQEEIDRGIYARVQSAEKKAEARGKELGAKEAQSTPEYIAGKIAVETRMAKDGVSREEAAKRIQQEHEQQENQRLAENPAEMVRTIKGLLAKEQPTTETPTQPVAPPTIEQFTQEAQNLFGEAIEAGLIPTDFTPTPELISAIYMNRSNPVKLAAEFAKLRSTAPVENDADADAQPKRNNAPIRTTGENARTVNKDWRDTPDADFSKVVEAAKERARNGEKTYF